MDRLELSFFSPRGAAVGAVIGLRSFVREHKRGWTSIPEGTGVHPLSPGAAATRARLGTHGAPGILMLAPRHTAATHP
jgi:hypothetical protein